jgi:hypothetical protein
MQSRLRQHSYDPVCERQLFSLPVDEATPGDLKLGSKNFVCLLAWDASGAAHDEISSLLQPLYLQGLSCLVCWGPDCERVHDIGHEIESAALATPERPPESVIMTTWHAKESLDEALWFLLNVTVPDPAYFDTTHATLAISVRNDAWLSQIREALDDLDAFGKKVLGDP